MRPPRSPARDPETLLLAAFVTRLEVLGATDDEIAAVRAGWDVLDDEWTPAYRRALATAPDARLTAHLAAIRAEYRTHTTTEDQAELERLLALEQAATYGAAGVIDSAVSVVLEWLRGAPTEEVMLARGYALEALEAGDIGRGRKGILGVVDPYARDWDARMIAAEAAAGIEPDEHLDADAEPFDPTPLVLEES